MGFQSFNKRGLMLGIRPHGTENIREAHLNKGNVNGASSMNIVVVDGVVLSG